MDKRKTGDLIRKARIEKQYTQTELGDLIGVTNKAVSRWENGESFPDVGILENLSEVLGIRVQDLVVGEIQADQDTALTEIVRIAKLQKRLTRNKVIWFIEAILILTYSMILGYDSLSGGSVAGENLGWVYLISLGAVFAILLFQRDRINLSQEKEAMHRLLIPVALISGVWVILAMGFMIAMLSHGILPFSLRASAVGPFFGYQFIGAFVVDFAITGWYFWGILRDKCYIDRGLFFSLAGLYLTAMYGDLLHRLSSVDHVREMVIPETILVIAEVAEAQILARARDRV